MAKPTARDEWWHAQSRLKAAIEAAGVHLALEQLNDRNSLIATAEQHERDRRQVIFSIADLELRRNVIRAERDCHG
jgi:hypothetical protein